MKRLIAVLFVGVFLCAGSAGAGMIPLPEATINLDGNAADWVGIDAILSDPQGDLTGGAGTDIESVYLAQDDDYLY